MCKFCPRIRAEAGGQRCDVTGWAVAGAVLSVVLAAKRRIVLEHAPRFFFCILYLDISFLYMYTHFLCVCCKKTKKLCLCLTNHIHMKMKKHP